MTDGDLQHMRNLRHEEMKIVEIQVVPGIDPQSGCLGRSRSFGVFGYFFPVSLGILNGIGLGVKLNSICTGLRCFFD